MAISTLSAQQPQSKESIDPAAQRRQVAAKLKEASEAELDVSAVRAATAAPAQRDQALAVLDEILETGPDMLAQHVLNFLSHDPQPELEQAVRARLGRLPEGKRNWSDEHLRFSAEYYLARLGDASARVALLENLEDPDPSLRLRTYRAVRDSALADDPWVTPEIIEVLKTAAEEESGAPGRIAALGAYAATAPSPEERALAEQKLQAAADKGGSTRSGLEAARAGFAGVSSERAGGQGEGKALPPGQEPGDENPETKNEEPRTKNQEPSTTELLEVARYGRHDEQMFALEILAEQADPEIEKEIAEWAESDNWRLRLRSAFYLVLTGNAATAKQRLATETNAMVQTALLSAMVWEQPATPPLLQPKTP